MAKKMRYKRSSFLIDQILNNEALPACYSKIQNTIAPHVAFENKNKTSPTCNEILISTFDVPSYITPILNNLLGIYNELIAPLYAGYLINLSAYANFQDYINKKIRRARWSQLKRYKKRLDLCLQPTYKIYYGNNLEKNEYDQLFKTLHVITEQRFQQKEEFNFEVPFLELYQQIMYPLIQDKKAAIFVIYHQNKPINITLNFIMGNTFFHWNSCYDVKYAVFNLGHINVVNHLEWCFNNNFKVFDMGRGDFLHKRKWVDTSYVYNEHVVYNKKSVMATLNAYYKTGSIAVRYYSIQALKKIKLQVLYSKFVHLKYRWLTKKVLNNATASIEINNNATMPNTTNLITINPFDSKYEILTEPLNYFLHRNQERFSDIKVYNEEKRPKCFYFKGLKNTISVQIVAKA